MNERIVKCDICGKQINSHRIFYKYSMIGWGEQNYAHGNIEYELCDGCWKKAHDYFFKMKGNKNEINNEISN